VTTHQDAPGRIRPAYPVAVRQRTSPFQLIQSGVLPPYMETPLKFFIGKWRRDEWMRGQKGWFDSAALLASSRVAQAELPVPRILCCSRKGRLCGMPWWCWRCALDQRIEPLQWQHRDSYDKAPYWGSLCVSLERIASRACCTLVSNYDLRGHPDAVQRTREFAGLLDRRGISSWPEDSPEYWGLVEGLFGVQKFLKRIGVRGAIIVGHLSPVFRRGFNEEDSLWMHCHHFLVPHVHVVLNLVRPISHDDLVDLQWWLVRRLVRRLDCLPYFPDTWYAPITSPESLRSALEYPLRPWPVHKWWRQATAVTSCPTELDALFDQVVLLNMNYLARRTRVQRYFGNLNPQNSGDLFIGERLPPEVSAKLATKWLKDKRYAAAHPQLEASVMRYLDKRDARQGRVRLNPATTEI
jgi:hypothetical protein